MIRAVFADKEITVQGHAGYAPKGQDIVCAAVSALVYALIAALEERDNLRETVIRTGYAAIRAKEKDTAFDVIRGGLRQIAARYPAYMTVETGAETKGGKS